MAANIPRFLPFVDWDEWISVKNGLYSTDPRDISVALEMVALWRVRGRLPLSIDSTAQLIELRLRDSPNIDRRNAYHSESELKLLYSAVVVRSVNGLVDPSQQGIYATSVLTLAERMGLPGWIVELRHDATHNQMPALGVLRNAANTLTSWYFNNYWQPQMSMLESLTVSCLPIQPSTATNLHSNPKLKVVPTSTEPVESTQQQDSSPTFVTEIFMPIFLGGVIHSAPEVPLNPETEDIPTLIKEETSRQHKFWHTRIKDLLRYNSYAAYALLYGLLGAAKDTLAQSQRHDIETYRAEWALEVVLFWVTEVISMASTVSGRAGASSSTAGAAHFSGAFVQALLVILQELAVDAKKSLSSKTEELIHVVAVFCNVDLSAPKSSIDATSKSQKKRKLGEEISDGRQSIGGGNKSNDSITRLNSFPTWTLGCMPGCSNPGSLHQIQEIL